MSKEYRVERLTSGLLFWECTSLRRAKAKARELLGVLRLPQPVHAWDGDEYHVVAHGTTSRKGVKIQARDAASGYVVDVRPKTSTNRGG
jgi:hypothetical protein